jgi:GDPmannose 4,6-dehydratase
MQKTALITGCNGQDGSYLAELLVKKGYNVHGLVKRSAVFDRQNIDHIGQLKLHYGDLSDFVSLLAVIKEVQPDEIYNLAAQSHVGISWQIPIYTAEITGIGVLNILEVVRHLGLKTKIYQASTSELFSGKKEEAPFNEESPLKPESPYSAAKLFAHEMCRIYREAYGMYIVRGILFNHEGERRGMNFVTRKISSGVANIIKGTQDKIHLGNIDAVRDWGYATDYVDGMWKMMQQEKPDDYVLATGEMHSIKEFLEEAFKQVNLDWKKYVQIDKNQFRPNETEYLCGDASKAKKVLNWEPKVRFPELVKIMVSNDLKQL